MTIISRKRARYKNCLLRKPVRLPIAAEFMIPLGGNLLQSKRISEDLVLCCLLESSLKSS